MKPDTNNPPDEATRELFNQICSRDCTSAAAALHWCEQAIPCLEACTQSWTASSRPGLMLARKANELAVTFGADAQTLAAFKEHIPPAPVGWEQSPEMPAANALMCLKRLQKYFQSTLQSRQGR
jgi:hypothetical protein